MKGISTRARILKAGVEVAKKSSVMKMIRDDVIHEADISVGTFHYHFNTMYNFREEVIKHALAANIPEIIGQAIASKHPLTSNLPIGKRLEALATLG